MLSPCLPQHPISPDHLNVFPLNTILVIFQQDILWSNFHVMTDRGQYAMPPTWPHECLPRGRHWTAVLHLPEGAMERGRTLVSIFVSTGSVEITHTTKQLDSFYFKIVQNGHSGYKNLCLQTRGNSERTTKQYHSQCNGKAFSEAEITTLPSSSLVSRGLPPGGFE